MNIYGGLLFNQGHVQDPATARMLAGAPDPAAGDAGRDRDTTRPDTRAEPAARPGARPGRDWQASWTTLLEALR